MADVVVRLERKEALALVSAGRLASGGRSARERARNKLRAALDHFTQQPAGVGADAPAFSAAEVPGSADSDGNQQVEAAAQELERLADQEERDEQLANGGRSGYASQFLREAAGIVRGDQQPQGGVVWCVRCGFVAGRRDEVDPFGTWRESGCIGGGEHGPTQTVQIQQSTGGQEGGVEGAAVALLQRLAEDAAKWAERHGKAELYVGATHRGEWPWIEDLVALHMDAGRARVAQEERAATLRAAAALVAKSPASTQQSKSGEGR